MSQDKIKIHKKQLIHDDFLKLYKVTFDYERYDGSRSNTLEWDTIFKSEAAGVIAYDPKSDEVILIEQVRHAAHFAGLPSRQIEVIAGMIDEGSTNEQTAIKEAKEEAGIHVSKLIPISKYLPAGGYLTELFHMYCGIVDLSNFKESIHGNADENEDIRAFKVKRAKAYEMIKTGEITSVAAQVAIFWLMLNWETI